MSRNCLVAVSARRSGWVFSAEESSSALRRACFSKFIIRGNFKSGPQGPVNGALVRIYAVDAFYGFSDPLGSIKYVMNMDVCNYQNPMI